MNGAGKLIMPACPAGACRRGKRRGFQVTSKPRRGGNAEASDPQWIAVDERALITAN